MWRTTWPWRCSLRGKNSRVRATVVGSSRRPARGAPTTRRPYPPDQCAITGRAAAAELGRPRRSSVPAVPRHTAASSVADRLADLSYVVVDVETTGGQLIRGRPDYGDRSSDRARAGRSSACSRRWVNPQRPIPPMVTSITNITWNMVRNAPTFRDIVHDVVRRYSAATSSSRITPVSTGASSPPRSREPRASGLEGRQLCTVPRACPLLPQLSRRSLDHRGVGSMASRITARHRAGGDAVATAHCLLRMLKGCARSALPHVARVGDIASHADARPSPAAPGNAAPDGSRHDGLIFSHLAPLV